MSNRNWLLEYMIMVFLMAGFIVILVYRIDPFMHYHKPCKKLFYTLDEERSENDGIIKNFDYDGIIIGTSMTENFKTSEANQIFERNFIKVPFAGATYKEINDNLKTACKSNDKLKVVIRCLDEEMLFDEKDRMRDDLGEYPTYLYDDNYFNDVKYIFNKDIIFRRIYPMLAMYVRGEKGGITSFDEYANWMILVSFKNFGKEAVLDGHGQFEFPRECNLITNEEIKRIRENVQQNVITLARENPNIEFDYFISPYSAVWWGNLNANGDLKKVVAGEKILIEETLPVKNIKLYSFNNMFGVTANLDNYKDCLHYGEWINTMILQCIKDDRCLLIQNNYLDYINQIYEFYEKFDYNSLFD